MISSALTLGFLGVASASPLSMRQTADWTYPDTAVSKGFKLVANVTGADLDPSVQFQYVTSIHVGAGIDLVGLSADAGVARIFYRNGTEDQVLLGGVTTVSDGGTPPAPASLGFATDGESATSSVVTLNNQAGAEIGISPFSRPYKFLVPETFVACDTAVGGSTMVTIKHANLTVDDDGTQHENIPEGCIEVRLMAQCAKLNDLPADAISSHEFAVDTDCYDDVASIDWPSYGPVNP